MQTPPPPPNAPNDNGTPLGGLAAEMVSQAPQVDPVQAQAVSRAIDQEPVGEPKQRRKRIAAVKIDAETVCKVGAALAERMGGETWKPSQDEFNNFRDALSALLESENVQLTPRVAFLVAVVGYALPRVLPQLIAYADKKKEARELAEREKANREDDNRRSLSNPGLALSRTL